MHAFIHQDTGIESLRNLVMEVHEEVQPDDFKFQRMYDDYIDDKVKQYLNEGIIYLVPENIHQIEPDELEEVLPPENGERVESNWVFMLSLPTLSDHTFWGIADRTGATPAYNYGFN
ncbi:MAG: hypothetical protein HC892_06715 [Saprospiraceae bacterium]|nr:hypothetical protein [Saprospiraceae bacterium]